MHRIYHGLNVDFADLLAHGSPEARPEDGCLRILSVGRLVPKKGFLTLVEACANLRQRGIVFECIIVGETGDEDPPARQALVALPGSPANCRSRGTPTRCVSASPNWISHRAFHWPAR